MITTLSHSGRRGLLLLVGLLAPGFALAAESHMPALGGIRLGKRLTSKASATVAPGAEVQGGCQP